MRFPIRSARQAAQNEQHFRSYVREVASSGTGVADELDWIEDPRAPQPQDVAETHLLYETIAELPRDFRDALVAVDVAGLPYREAARALRIREATLTTRLFRARKRVARAFGDPTSAGGRFSPGPRLHLTPRLPSL